MGAEAELPMLEDTRSRLGLPGRRSSVTLYTLGAAAAGWAVGCGAGACTLTRPVSRSDTRTEALIEKGMDRLMEGRTVFVIAHRLSTVRNSNAIIVLEHGGIVERGSHDELLAQKGEYYQLYNGMFELA